MKNNNNFNFNGYINNNNNRINNGSNIKNMDMKIKHK